MLPRFWQSFIKLKHRSILWPSKSTVRTLSKTNENILSPQTTTKNSPKVTYNVSFFINLKTTKTISKFKFLNWRVIRITHCFQILSRMHKDITMNRLQNNACHSRRGQQPRNGTISIFSVFCIRLFWKPTNNKTHKQANCAWIRQERITDLASFRLRSLPLRFWGKLPRCVRHVYLFRISIVMNCC